MVPNPIWLKFFKMRKFGHRHAQRYDPIKIQGTTKEQSLSMKQPTKDLLQKV